jgi:drug/metabolite transporter (DMT)-like permease
MIVAVILAVSVASERLVEIIKNYVPYLSTKKLDDANKEARRAAAIQLIAIAANVFTALLCWPALSKVVPATWGSIPVVLALGFLASGGSAFWNSIQTYLLKLKDIEAAAAKTAQKALREDTAIQKPIDFKIVA